MNRRKFLRDSAIAAGGMLISLMPVRLEGAYLENLETITVDNFQYFRAEDSNTRKYMKQFETEVVQDLARQAVIDAEIQVDTTIPVEGYYHETPELTKTFLDLRALQSNYTEARTPSIEQLHAIYSHPVFGQMQGIPTKINPNYVLLPNENPVTISPVADPVSIAMNVKIPLKYPDEWMAGQIDLVWTINKIMDETSEVMEETGEKDRGVSLVGFAYAVDEAGKQSAGYWAPLATTLAMETTVLSRLKGMYKGIRPQKKVEWNVDGHVEEHGKRVVDAYNDLFSRHWDSDQRMPQVTPDNVEGILDKAPDVLRVVNIGIQSSPPPTRYYHWGIIENGSEHGVVDFWAKRIVTAKEWETPSVRNYFREISK